MAPHFCTHRIQWQCISSHIVKLQIVKYKFNWKTVKIVSIYATKNNYQCYEIISFTITFSSTANKQKKIVLNIWLDYHSGHLIEFIKIRHWSFFVSLPYPLPPLSLFLHMLYRLHCKKMHRMPLCQLKFVLKRVAVLCNWKVSMHRHNYTYLPR